jgi:hypothetical protein
MEMISSDEDLFNAATRNAQKWANYLWTSGGGLNLSKCFFYAFQPYYNYKKHCTSYKKLSETTQISVTNPADNTHQQLLSLSPSDARRTLGVILALDGNGKSQMMSSLSKAREFFGKFKNGFMSSKAQWMAITTVIEPAIIYPLVNYTDKEISTINSLTSRMKCLALGLNRNFPGAFLHGPLSLGGIGIPSSSNKNTKDRINYFFLSYAETRLSA